MSQDSANNVLDKAPASDILPTVKASMMKNYFPRLGLIGLIFVVISACSDTEADVTPEPSVPGVTAFTVEPQKPAQPGSVAPHHPPAAGGEQITQITNPQLGSPSTGAATKTVTCGVAPGINGTTVEVVAFGDAPCSQVMPVAQSYASQTGNTSQITVNDWICGPTALDGYIGQCLKDGLSFALKEAS